MKVTVNIEGVKSRTIDIDERDGAESLKTFKLTGNIDDAKLWFVGFSGRVMEELNAITNELFPPELDPIEKAMMEAGITFEPSELPLPPNVFLTEMEAQGLELDPTEVIDNDEL